MMPLPTEAQANRQFLLRYLRRHQWSYALGVGLLLLTNVLAVSIPQYVGAAIDLLAGAAFALDDDFRHNILMIVLLAVLMMFARTASRMLFFNPGRAIEREIKDDAFARLTLMQRDFYEANPSGTLISIVNNDINGVRALAGVVLLQIFNIAFALSLTPYRMWELSPHLTLFCMVPVVVTFVISHKAIARMRQLMKIRMQELQALSTHTVELLSGIDVIRSHQIRPWAEAEFDADNRQLLDRSVQLAWLRTIVIPVLGYTDRIMKVLILAVGGLYVIRSDLSLGQLVAFLSYATLLAMPFFSMAMILSAFHNGMVSIESLRKILDQPPDPRDLVHLDERDRETLFSAGVSVRHLSFCYPGQDHPVLRDISFDIAPGQTVGVLGQVGSGKSTLVNCLNRHLPVGEGMVFIDEHDISALSGRDLRSAVRTITQEPFLFSDTVENNIRFSAGDQHYRDLEEVLYQSDLIDEVKQFPDGVDTLVGEKGILLSGGQKQRLSLARALYTPSKLLILDNVLSAVDNETERFLLEQIFSQLQSQSILIVSHRATVLERVDRILVLADGEIVARGTHEELMHSSSLYRDTWLMQQEGDHE